MTPKFEASDFSNLVLEVHTVGYPTQGESIVTMLKDGDRVLFTVVTAAFYTDSSDEVSAILHRNGDPNINIFVWTHPDEDHSVGIEKVREMLITQSFSGFLLIWCFFCRMRERRRCLSRSMV